MTKVLNIALLGPLQLTLDEEPVESLASVKAQALLCYLAFTGRTHSRQALAGLLWSDLPEADARRNLRGVLMKLRQAVEPHITVTHQTISFNREAAYWLDVESFRVGGSGRVQALTVSELAQAATLYRGEFLNEFYVRQAPHFESWLEQTRLEMQSQAVVIYHQLAEGLGADKAYKQGIETARRLVSLESTREASYRVLMQLLAADGQRATALAQYERCREVLQTELGVAVSEETSALAEAIRSGQFPGQQRPSALPATPRTQDAVPTLVDQSTPAFIAGPPITAPERFFGRQREIRRLFGLLRQLPLQNAAIIGPRRSGKTSLLHYLANITTTAPQQLRSQQNQTWLSQPEQYRWVFVDFQDPRMGKVDNLLRYLLQKLGFPLPNPCDIDAFFDIVSEHLQSPTIIMFDEIGVAMARYPELDDAFWESLRALATNYVGGNLGFVLASHEPPDILAQGRGLGSPFFNIFGYTAVLGPLSEAAARELIASSPRPFPEADVDWILTSSACWPMPLQILCRERLMALEESDDSTTWREEGLRQILPFIPEAKGI